MEGALALAPEDCVKAFVVKGEIWVGVMLGCVGLQVEVLGGWVG